ncbi:MAG: hypothetical protein APF78_01905 [Sphingomonadales bacterium BRH_c3]|nr:MAG: hypothetical protein APF78_01905 [Sphingomonadales bacterium BRH_c3]
MPAPDAMPTPRRWGWLVLLTSTTTLVCCVIPIALVFLGLGGAVASLYGNFPFLTFLGLHKDWTFAITALIMLAAAWALFRPGRACPADPELARACNTADRWNRRLLTIAFAIWLISLFAAYALLPLAQWLGYL